MQDLVHHGNQASYPAGEKEMLQRDDQLRVVYSGIMDNRYSLVIEIARTGEGIDKTFGGKGIKGKNYFVVLKVYEYKHLFKIHT